MEESVLRIERLRPQFVKIPEVDSLAELVVEESRDWDDIQNKFDLLTHAWNSVSQNNDPSLQVDQKCPNSFVRAFHIFGRIWNIRKMARIKRIFR